MTRLLQAWLLATAPSAIVSARSDEKLHLAEDGPDSWLDCEAELPSWQISYCVHNPVKLKCEDEDFKSKCEEAYIIASEECVNYDYYTKRLQPSERVSFAKQFAHQMGRDVTGLKNTCQNHQKNMEDAMKEASMDRNIETAVRLCEQELPDVCLRWCETKKILTKTEDVDCASSCEAMVPFNTGAMSCGNVTWRDCLLEHKTKLIEVGRDPELEAIMREMTLKCVCVARPPSGVLEGHERCFKKKKSGGLLLDKGQKWCEWHDHPSWRFRRRQWANDFEDQRGPMPLPTCTEFPK